MLMPCVRGSNWMMVDCGQLPKTLSLFITKICDFPYPINYDLAKNSKPYLRPDPVSDLRYNKLPSCDQC